MPLIRFIVTLFLISSALALPGQTNCYDDGLNHSGIDPSVDSLDYFSCQLDAGMPAAVTTEFKVFSVVEYALHKYKDQADITRYKEQTIDSLRTVNPFNLVFWWSPAAGNDLFGKCEIAFTYPGDNAYQNCFSSVKQAIIASQLQQIIDARLSATTQGGATFRVLEKEIVVLLNEKIQAIQDCCAGTANKNEEACTACPDAEGLADLKRRAHLNKVGSRVSVSNDPSIIVTLTENTTVLNKSNPGFLNLVGTNLFFGEIEIDLQAEYDAFLALGDTICAYPAYFTTDEALCDLEIDNWDRGDRSIINLSPTEDGYILEMSEYTDTDCYLFGDYILDQYVNIFGGRLFLQEEEGLWEDLGPQGRGSNDDTPAKSSV
ncbi:MAG: hypothetical protein AAF840_08840, partial [Bacteroidota bacterium]